jgi:tetratricopeptide (TPR) repeat protein
VGRDLGVGAVLTGRVSQRGDTLVIGAELVDVAQGTQLWGERYNTRMADISALQEDIARDISRKLRRKVAPRDETSLTRRHTENGEAYRLYLLSLYHTSTAKTPEGFRRAVEYAQQAIERDPTYAQAYLVLAHSYTVLGSIGQLSNRDALSRARTAVMKALEIDESLPEAHAVLAEVQSRLDWDWAGAERGFKRALELNPNSANAHDGYSFYLAQMGRSEESMAHAKRAVELDPLTPGRRHGIVWAYYFARQFDQALKVYREMLEFDPNLGNPYLSGWIYREKGMYEEAIAEFRQILKQSPGAPFALGHLGNAYARAGRVREARECLRKLKQRSNADKVGTYEVAFIYAGLGEKDQAFEWLEKAYEERDQGLSFLKVDPTLDPLRSDPRFQDLLRRMNFPPSSQEA